MTQATKTLAILFSFSVLLAATLKMYSGRGFSEALGTQVLRIHPEEIARISIHNSEIDSVSLYKDGSGWRVTGNRTDNRYEASTGMVDAALASLQELIITSVPTRNPDQHRRYRVDGTGTIVELFNANDNRVAGIVLGEAHYHNEIHPNTYVRVLGEENVYSVDGFITQVFDNDVHEWREKTIWNIPGNEIRQIELTYPDNSTFTIVRDDNASWTTVSGDNTQTNARNILINTLAHLRAEGFIDNTGPATAGLDNPRFRISITLASGQEQGIILANIPDDHRLVAKADTYPYVFTLGNSFRNNVLRSREDFIE